LNLLFQPSVHFIPVKEDLSDLITQIQWCKTNDAQCQKIANNALNFYNKYLLSSGILDFLEKELWDLSKHTGVYKYLPDLLKLSIQDEQKQLNDSVVFTNDIYPYVLQDGWPRCIGVLDGMLTVFRSKKIEDLIPETEIFKNINGRIVLYNCKNFKIVGKHGQNNNKILENIHETYIGLNAINQLVSKVPNFVYVFGQIKDFNHIVFTEHIQGISMMHWLSSNQYNFPDFLSILVQINLALITAQNLKGFIHYDLTPWNIILQDLSHIHESQRPVFTYYLTCDLYVTIRPKIIPIIIDYGKSRVVIYEKNNGCIDHGFFNLYKTSSISDTLTLLYSSLNVLKKNKNISRELSLLAFPQHIGLSHPEDIQHWGKFGAFIHFNKNINPKQFIDHIFITYHNEKPVLHQTNVFHYLTEKGNAFHTAALMKYNDMYMAALDLAHHIDNSRPAQSYNVFIQNAIINIIDRRLLFINEKILELNNEKLTKTWKTIEKTIKTMPDASNKEEIINWPKIKKQFIDSEISYDYLETIKPENTNNDVDWILFHILCLETYLFKNRLKSQEYLDFIRIDGFNYLNSLASNDTLAKLKNTILINN
jgi:hypothetical protein